MATQQKSTWVPARCLIRWGVVLAASPGKHGKSRESGPCRISESTALRGNGVVVSGRRCSAVAARKMECSMASMDLGFVEMKPSSLLWLLCPLLRLVLGRLYSTHTFPWVVVVVVVAVAVSCSAPLVLCLLVGSTLRRLFKQRASQAGRCAAGREQKLEMNASEVEKPTHLAQCVASFPDPPAAQKIISFITWSTRIYDVALPPVCLDAISKVTRLAADRIIIPTACALLPLMATATPPTVQHRPSKALRRSDRSWLTVPTPRQWHRAIVPTSAPIRRSLSYLDAALLFSILELQLEGPLGRNWKLESAALSLRSWKQQTRSQIIIVSLSNEHDLPDHTSHLVQGFSNTTSHPKYPWNSAFDLIITRFGYWHSQKHDLDRCSAFPITTYLWQAQVAQQQHSGWVHCEIGTYAGGSHEAVAGKLQPCIVLSEGKEATTLRQSYHGDRFHCSAISRCVKNSTSSPKLCNHRKNLSTIPLTASQSPCQVPLSMLNPTAMF
ncbi:uncharacterized protein MYCFIDRAFT_207219 [Pseudocercospora fijiensis CIRAD86]|uniref:Uncharacterized protein n=1 Tax=Pseudocercospora fijiensis (strain CIRAD86) TaxID=383855 RepID=M2ZZC9_PSEFD|nr:uncharacterized protein MYCFIDRAFT_207219 [Pseudocercospora fijiensis CIRAD86]EME84259.1 hypothetical protein MYCFIDRAFT_207219 [Pseudocercospora fijiensis CIRAD86]